MTAVGCPITVDDAIEDLQRSVWALEGMEALAFASDRVDQPSVKVDHVANLLYVVRTRIEASLEVLSQAAFAKGL